MTITQVSKKAAEREKEYLINKEAQELYDKLIANKYKYLDTETIFEPTYFECLCKNKFYANGGSHIRAYNIANYAELLEVPEVVVTKWVDERPTFFVWLHEKRTFQEEMEDLCLMAARQMINNFKDAGLRDKAQALNTLSRFTGLLSPKKEDMSDIDDILSKVKTPEEVTTLLKEYGFIKTGDEGDAMIDRLMTESSPLAEEDIEIKREEL